MKFDNEFKEVKIRHIVIIFLIILLISIAISVVLNINADISNTDTNKLSLLMEILFSAMVFFMLNPNKKNINLLYKDFKSKLNVKEIILITLFIKCLEIGSSNILTYIAYVIGPNFAKWFINDSSMVINSMTDYWIIFIMAVFLAPFTEEIIFRNVLFKRISKKFNIYIGLIVSSVIFSSLNFGNQMIGLFLFGIVNCMLYVKYENIFMPMLIYFINNVIDMLKVILLGEFGNETVVLTSKNMFLYSISGISLFIIGIIFFVKFIINNKVYLRESYNKSKMMTIS